MDLFNKLSIYLKILFFIPWAHYKFSSLIILCAAVSRKFSEKISIQSTNHKNSPNYSLFILEPIISLQHQAQMTKTVMTRNLAADPTNQWTSRWSKITNSIHQTDLRPKPHSKTCHWTKIANRTANHSLSNRTKTKTSNKSKTSKQSENESSNNLPCYKSP